jgi:hypothetical protein
MATTTLVLPVALRGGSTPGASSPFIHAFSFPANNWKHLSMKINSTDWNTINGLFLGYTARVTVDGGTTWRSWGGLTATSPTVRKDGTKSEPEGVWEWDPTFSGGGTLEITVTCPTAFNWGATVTMLDT